jgi:RsiW-degrading membrane proteinase PrsW (M82 family)
VVAASVALLPVVLFLAALEFCDSFKLVTYAAIGRAVVIGVLAAGGAWLVYLGIRPLLGVDEPTYSQYIAPFTEETVKALCVVWALHRRHVGFLVDAAIIGFAIGAGFALAENIEYLARLHHSGLLVWFARGFGTAMLHAATTSIVAVGTKALADRMPDHADWAWVPPFICAVGLHAVYNQALVSPILAAAVCLTVLPIVVIVVFDHSEQMTREWVSAGLDLDVELLQLTRSALFADTRLGRYLVELGERFPGLIVADMFCLLQVDLELAIRAKSLLLARQAGLNPPVDEDVRDLIAERGYLRHSIGATGLVALRPLLKPSPKDEWNEYLLERSRR